MEQLPAHCSQTGDSGESRDNKNIDNTGPKQQILVIHLRWFVRLMRYPTTGPEMVRQS